VVVVVVVVVVAVAVVVVAAAAAAAVVVVGVVVVVVVRRNIHYSETSTGNFGIVSLAVVVTDIHTVDLLCSEITFLLNMHVTMSKHS
jgi:hypothetical protein